MAQEPSIEPPLGPSGLTPGLKPGQERDEQGKIRSKKDRKRLVAYGEPEGDRRLPATYRAMKLVMSRPEEQDATQYEVDAREFRKHDAIKFQQTLTELDIRYAVPQEEEKPVEEDSGREKVVEQLEGEWAAVQGALDAHD